MKISPFPKRLVHWDVDNENLHGGWFDEKTEDPDIMVQMFEEANQADPNVKLFINDFEVVNSNLRTIVSNIYTNFSYGTIRVINFLNSIVLLPIVLE